MLTTADKNFINSSFELVKKEFKADVQLIKQEFHVELNHSLGLYLDQHKHEFQLVKELIETRPTRDEVREIVYDIVHEEMGNHVSLYHLT